MNQSTIFRTDFLSANNYSCYANGFVDATCAAVSDKVKSETAFRFITCLAENMQRQNNLDIFDGSFNKNSYGLGWIEGIMSASDDEQYFIVEQIYNNAASEAYRAWFKLTGVVRPVSQLSNRMLIAGFND